MSGHVLLNLLSELRKSDKCEACPSSFKEGFIQQGTSAAKLKFKLRSTIWILSKYCTSCCCISRWSVFWRLWLGLILLPQNVSHFVSYASQGSPPITHNQDVHDLDFFIRGGIFGAARPSISRSISLNALSPHFKLCCTFYHCAVRRIYIKSTWISLGGIPFPEKYLITTLISSFSFL